MIDETVQTARLWKVAKAVVDELDRQGVAEVLVNCGFDVLALAKVAIKAADGDVVPLKRAPA